MKTNSNTSLEGEQLKVPLDMAPDIFSILVSEGLAHEITDASAERWYFRMMVYYDKTEARQKKAVSDIQQLLENYYDYRSATHDELNWR